MIIKIENDKISKIIIGDQNPPRGFIPVPDEWGTEEIRSHYILGQMNVKQKSYSINDGNPEESFELERL